MRPGCVQRNRFLAARIVRAGGSGRTVIDQRVEGLDFKGGYIGFSGTTGYYTNFHRFDDLRTRPACEP